jgi:hypothetical protein
MTRLLRSNSLYWFLFAAVLALGILITPHYGESWDERQFYKYADRALQAYSTWPSTGEIPLTGNTYDNYGPAYVMLTTLGARLLGLFVPGYVSDLRHLVYFLTFLLGVWAFFHLCRRWLSAVASVGATLLFATEPVIWGHAFISPKDVPFLTFFVLTLLLGFRMVDELADQDTASPRVMVPPILLRLSLIWLAVVFGLLITSPLVRSAIENLVRAAAAGQANILSQLASDVRTADPLIYVRKYFVWYLHLRLALILVLTLGLLTLWRRRPHALRRLGLIGPAAIVLGFNTSIRILGPFAALMVAAYAVYRLRRRALPTLLVYAVLALLTMYLTWPYLWPDPLGHLVESAIVMSRYPWRGEVLYAGTLYPSTGLPASYLPVLLAIQLTETAWLAILSGVVIALVLTLRRVAAAGSLLLLALVWCVLPLLGFIISHSPLYDNFRQVLFVLPPLFILAGLAFDRIDHRRLRFAAIALAVLPGIIAGALLHPYEYIYYNSLVGSTHGAFRRYELDYWGTSYREAANYLAEVAPANATVWVEGPTHLLQLYARPDLKIYSTYESARLDRYDYVVALTRFDLDLTSYPDAPVVHIIQRDGAALTVIKKP